MKFEISKHYKFRSILKDYYHGEPDIQVTHWQHEDDLRLISVLTLAHGACNLQIDISSNEARDLAYKLTEFADELDAHASQIAVSSHETLEA